MKTTKRFIDSGISGLVARWYDHNTKKNCIPKIRQYAKEIAGYIKDNDTVLEIAPGPGQLSIELAKLGNFYIIGVEFDYDFVDIAQQNAEEEGVEIDFQQGDAGNITFPDNSFDFIICTAALSNLDNPVQALNEAYRVLKPGGTLFTIHNHHLERWSLKSYLQKGAYSKDKLEEIIKQTYFKNSYAIKEKDTDMCTYLHKLQ